MADTPTTDTSTTIRAQRRKVVVFVAILFVIALGIGVFAIRAIPGHTQVANALSLSAVVLTGLTLIVVLMAGLVLVYFYTDVTNGTQALALPEGSVRALLAFSLVLIFVAMAAFLYSNVNAADINPVGSYDRITETQINNLKTQFVVVYEAVLVMDQDKEKQCVAPSDAAKQSGSAPNTPAKTQTGQPDAAWRFCYWNGFFGEGSFQHRRRHLFRLLLRLGRFKNFRSGVSLPKLIYLRNIMLIRINKIKQFAVFSRIY